MSKQVTIQSFSEAHRLTVKRDSCGEAIIAGRPRKAKRNEDRNHIFEYADGQLAICLLMGTVGKWNNRKKTALAAGFTLAQDASVEGTLLFDAQNAKHAQLAISLVGCRTRKELTLEQTAILKERGKRLQELRQAK
jgi:hypothetical protein